MDRRIWQIQVVIEATRPEADQTVTRIERALCPDPEHEGPCAVPWTVILSEVDDDEQAEWKASFNDERP